MAKVNFTVDDERKEVWRAYAEEEWSGNLSMMARRAVERMIADDGGGEAAVQDVHVDLSELHERLDGIASTLDRLDARMDAMEADEDVERIAGRVSEWLPTMKPGSDPWEDQLFEIRTGGVPDRLPTDDPALAELAWQGTPGSISNVSGYPEPLVREALGKLERSVLVIHSVELNDGSTAYYREAGR